ncbi:MAG: sodium:calcium antiporter [bacterium]
MIPDLLIIAICFFFIFKSADILVSSSSRIAAHYGIPPVFIGLVLVGLGTSAPEIFVTAIASYTKHPGVVIGNATGSIACNAGLAMAVIFWLLKPGEAPADMKALGSRFCLVNGLFLAGGAAVMMFFLQNGVSPLKGLALLAVVILYLFVNSRISKKFAEVPAPEGKIWVVLVKLFCGLAALVIASKFLVVSATSFAEKIGIPEIIIGITLIAVGTSIPEIATSISATRQGKIGIAVGELVGSQALNLYLLLGLASLIRPFAVENSKHIFGWMAFILGELMLLIWLKKIPSKLKALIALFTYAVYIAFNFRFLMPA